MQEIKEFKGLDLLPMVASHETPKQNPSHSIGIDLQLTSTINPTAPIKCCPYYLYWVQADTIPFHWSMASRAICIEPLKTITKLKWHIFPRCAFLWTNHKAWPRRCKQCVDMYGGIKYWWVKGVFMVVEDGVTTWCNVLPEKKCK